MPVSEATSNVYAPKAAAEREPHVSLQDLEARQMLSVSVDVGRNVNVSGLPMNQAEATIAINRQRPNELFSASNMEEVGEERSLFAASSFDGGRTWRCRIIAGGDDGLPPAEGDPSAAYDTHGNLFLAYLMATRPDDTNQVAVLVSRDNGRSFRVLNVFDGDLDQPTVTASGGSVWVSFKNYDTGNEVHPEAVEIAGAPISAKGKVGAFSDAEQVAGSELGNYADLAIGPKGQVLVTYEDPEEGESLSGIFVATDPDGLGPKSLSAPRLASSTFVGGFDFIRPQNNRSIDAEPGVVFDRSGGPFTGRAYLVYTDEAPDESDNTDILLRYSDDNGVTWSAPLRVNDDRTANSQFFPRMQVDQTTGLLAIAWHDARNDLGVPGKGSTNVIANDDTQLWATVVIPTRNGLEVGRNFRVSTGTSNADSAESRIDYGDYTGIDFNRGAFYPVWADNSNSTGDNRHRADESVRTFDVYAARVEVKGAPFHRGDGGRRGDDDDRRPDSHLHEIFERLLEKFRR